MNNDFLDNLAADQYQKMHSKETIEQLKRQVAELQAEIATLKALHR